MRASLVIVGVAVATDVALAKGRGGSGKRELIQNSAGTFYGTRDARGRFKQMDERGRSLSTDVRQPAKKEVAPGYGDQGDQPRR
jgi:hypothetical protein